MSSKNCGSRPGYNSREIYVARGRFGRVVAAEEGEVHLLGGGYGGVVRCWVTFNWVEGIRSSGRTCLGESNHIWGI